MVANAYHHAQERRAEERCKSVIAIGKIEAGGVEKFCLVRNVSASGLMIETTEPMTPGERVRIEMAGLDPCEAAVVWYDNQHAGLAFDKPQYVGDIGRRVTDARGWVTRGPRFTVDRVAQLRIDGREHIVEILNVSVGGARVRGLRDVDIHASGQVIFGAGLSPVPGHVRWIQGDDAGFKFSPALDRTRLLAALGDC